MRRNKWLLLLAVAILLLLLPILSCLQAPAATPANAATSADPVAHQSDIVLLRAQLTEKGSAGSVTALETRMAVAEGNIRTLQVTPAGAGLTQAQVDAAIDAKLTALKNDQAWITGATHTTPAGTTTGEFGILVGSDGDLELWVDKVAPGSSPYTEDGANNGVLYFGRLTVVNTDTVDRHSFDLNLFITPDANCEIGHIIGTANCTQLTTNGDDFSGFVTGRTLTGNWTYIVKEDYEFDFRTAGHGSIKADSYERYVVSLDLYQLTPIYEVYWDWGWEITDRE